MSRPQSPPGQITSAPLQLHSHHPNSPPPRLAPAYSHNMSSPATHMVSTPQQPYVLQRRPSEGSVNRYQQPMTFNHVSPFSQEIDRKLTNIEHQNGLNYMEATAENEYISPQDENYDPDQSFCLTIFCVFTLVVAVFCLAVVVYLILKNQLTPTWPPWKEEPASFEPSHSHLSTRYPRQ